MNKLLTIILMAPLAAGAADKPAAPGAPAPAARQAAESAEQLKSSPPVPASRFVVGDPKDYLALMKQKLAINKRGRGPFGLSQVPGTTPMIPQSITRKKRVETPFSDFVRAIRVSVIFAADREFLVGSRIFRTGQVFPLVAGGETIKVRIEAVKPTSVQFRNLTTNEVAIKRLDLLPAGISANNGRGGSVPGVTPRGTSDAQPLHLDLLSPPPTP